MRVRPPAPARFRTSRGAVATLEPGNNHVAAAINARFATIAAARSVRGLRSMPA